MVRDGKSFGVVVYSVFIIDVRPEFLQITGTVTTASALDISHDADAAQNGKPLKTPG